MSEVVDLTLGNAALHGGITNDLERRQAEHRQEWKKDDSEEVDGYKGIEFDHETFNHSVGENVRRIGRTPAIESFWAVLKRAHEETFHKNGPKHLPRYVPEIAGRHHVREADTADQKVGVVAGMVGKRLHYNDLIAEKRLDSGARA